MENIISWFVLTSQHKVWEETRIFFRIIAQNSGKWDLLFHIYWWSSPSFLAVNTSSNAITPSSPLPKNVCQGKCNISIVEKIFDKETANLLSRTCQKKAIMKRKWNILIILEIVEKAQWSIPSYTSKATTTAAPKVIIMVQYSPRNPGSIVFKPVVPINFFYKFLEIFVSFDINLSYIRCLARRYAIIFACIHNMSWIRGIWSVYFLGDFSTKTGSFTLEMSEFIFNEVGIIWNHFLGLKIWTQMLWNWESLVW